MLSGMVPTLRPKALVVEAEVIYYIIAEVCLYMGINLAVNEDWQQCVSDIWQSFTEPLQDWFNRKFAMYHAGYSFIADMTCNEWANIVTEIHAYFNQPSMRLKQGTVTCNDDGICGFTDDTTFSLSFPYDTKSAYYAFKDCVITLYDRVSFDTVKMVSDDRIGTLLTQDSIVYGLHVTNSEGMTFVAALGDTYHVDRCSSLQGRFFTPYLDSGTSYSRLALANNEVYIALDECIPAAYVPRYFVYNDELYHIDSYTEGYCLVNNSGSVYKNMFFGSTEYLYSWFWHSCGFVDRYSETKDGVISYDPDAATVNPGTAVTSIDDDVLNGKLQEAKDKVASGEGTSIVVPADEAGLEDLAANPSLVTDLTGGLAVYPSDFPQIDTSPALWKTKFPFCLPWDIYNLFAQFSAEPQAPKFHMLVLPENSFGLNNEEVYWDIDFAPVDKLVKILRLFISLSFVLWLILITRQIT